MTSPAVAAENPALVLSRRLLVALGAAARGEAPGDALTELTDRGLLGPDGRLAASVAATAVAVGSPVATVRVTAVRRAGTGAADIWVGPSRAVLHPAGEGSTPVVSVDRALLPQLLVRTIGLGPRPRAGLPAFRAAGPDVAAACRGTAPAPWPESGDERPELWRVAWRSVAGAEGDVAVLDRGPQGLWRPGPREEDRPTWSPVDAGPVWQALARLFSAALEDRPAF
jgi:hypothetical protein